VSERVRVRKRIAYGVVSFQTVEVVH
jgi:hypothetical protein